MLAKIATKDGLCKGYTVTKANNRIFECGKELLISQVYQRCSMYLFERVNHRPHHMDEKVTPDNALARSSCHACNPAPCGLRAVPTEAQGAGGPQNSRQRESGVPDCHLEGRQAPQASSAFRTPTAGSLQSWDRRVRPRLV